MQMSKIIKFIAMGATAIWLAGCASKSGDNVPHDKKTASGFNDRGNRSDVNAEAVAVNDAGVTAVINSHKVNASPEKIKEMLNQRMFNFGFDSSKLDDVDYESLEAQAVYLNSNAGKDVNIRIHGHTDERGTRTYNLALGERRGNALKNYLVVKGVSSSRISVISFGFEKPLDVTHTPDAWNKNRRAVVFMSSESE